jgi:hypothetical protein
MNSSVTSCGIPARGPLRGQRRTTETRYADKTVAAFAGRLKDAVDLDAVHDHLAGVVQKAGEPAMYRCGSPTATNSAASAPAAPPCVLPHPAHPSGFPETPSGIRPASQPRHRVALADESTITTTMEHRCRYNNNDGASMW